MTPGRNDANRDQSLRELAREQLQGQTPAADAGDIERATAQQRLVQHALADHFAQAPVPEDLAASVQAALDHEDAQRVARPGDELTNRANPAHRHRRPRRRARGWGIAAGLAATLLLMLGALRLIAPQADLVQAAVEDFAALQSGALSLDLPAPTPADLERAFAAQDLGFDTRVFDLAMMDYRVVGGRVHRLAGRPSALFVYQQAATRARLLCQMYAGVMDELPATGEVLEHRGIRFQVYRSGGVTAVFWPEGPIICVLVSDQPAAQVIALAFEKAVAHAI